MATFSFYNVKTRQKEEIDESQIRKTTYVNKKTGRTSYALRAKGSDGTNLTKFVTEDVYNSLNVPTE